MSTALEDGWRIGVDIGGTFTDLVLTDPIGGVRVFKVPTVPADPERGAFNALAAAAAATLAQSLPRCLCMVRSSR